MIFTPEMCPETVSYTHLDVYKRQGLLPVVQLTEIFRQSMQSLIVTNAHQIVQGQMPELGRKDGDFFFLPNQYPVSIRDTIVDLCLRRLPASYGYSPVFDIQVLSPGRKGELGTIALNQSLQSAVNPPEKGIKKEITVNGCLLYTSSGRGESPHRR